MQKRTDKCEKNEKEINSILNYDGGIAAMMTTVHFGYFSSSHHLLESEQTMLWWYIWFAHFTRKKRRKRKIQNDKWATRTGSEVRTKCATVCSLCFQHLANIISLFPKMVSYVQCSFVYCYEVKRGDIFACKSFFESFKIGISRAFDHFLHSKSLCFVHRYLLKSLTHKLYANITRCRSIRVCVCVCSPMTQSLFSANNWL